MSSRRLSVLDKMGEVAEEQQADNSSDDADLVHDYHTDNHSSDDELLMEEDEDDDDFAGDNEEEDDDDDVLTDDDDDVVQMIQSEELAHDLRLLEEGELEEILDASFYQYGDTYNTVNTGTQSDMDDSEVWDTPTPLEPNSLRNLDGSNHKIKMFEENTPGDDYHVFQGSASLPNAKMSPGSGKRRSFVANHRHVLSESDIAVPAPPLEGESGAGDNDYGYESQAQPQAQRRNTFTVPNDQAGDDKRKGRKSIHRTSGASASSSNSNPRRRDILGRLSTRPGAASTDDDSSLSSSGFRPFAARRSTRGARGSTSTWSNERSSGGSSSTYGLAAAATILGKQDTNSDWENVAAAANVVAAGAGASSKRSHVQFGANDHVLVMLSLINYINNEDDPDTFTIDPVNALGYPVGGGNTEAERQGPFSFVLATVTNVHFDEDERYYTVKRFDTNTEQRAEGGWLEPIKDLAAIEAAIYAAHRTTRSAAEDDDHVVRHDGLFQQVVMVLSGCVLWPAHFARTTLRPFYRDFRLCAKEIATSTIHGEKGFAYRVSCTSINVLVLCSFTYLFLEPISLAFLPCDYDYGVAITEFIVWIILGLELFFEFLIRPEDYHELITSDKAFAPSTARHINSFHLFFETLSLLLFIPQLPCVFRQQCGDDIYFSAVWASIHAVTDHDGTTAAWARARLGLTFLKAFGLFRHWKQMWINRTFERGKTDSYILRRLLLIERKRPKPFQRFLKKRKLDDDADTTVNDDEPSENMADDWNEEDQGLKNAATIGTSLMVVNSHRALFILLFILTLFPAIYTMGRQNPVSYHSTDLLQAYNLAANTTEDCAFLENAVNAWLKSSGSVPASHQFTDEYDDTAFLIWGRLLPYRCDWQELDGVISVCPSGTEDGLPLQVCDLWKASKPDDFADATKERFADEFNLRVGGFRKFVRNMTAPVDFVNSTKTEDQFYVEVIFSGGHYISLVQTELFMLLVAMLILGLVGLTAMRGDAGRLVLDPLQRMLKIVVRYAENPLSHTVSAKGYQGASEKTLDAEGGSGEQLGNYETEQLINAIAKIADLLRKCWGVAGAGIISSNLARTKDGKTVVFNPTVPGKRVYALFGFVGINDFSNLLRALDRDVMILINDVSRVVHDEVYRWSLGGSGQCNKNLGSAFLMVFRIGDFNEVHAKQEQATAVVFDSQMRSKVKIRRRRSSQTSKRRGANRYSSQRRASSRQFDLGSDGTMQLSSLPGIQSFTDRALLGMLKSFAGIHRDKKLYDWQNDFRLGGGVGAFTVSVIYGMDAGWAVEGAVGSEYKIDATYLSPHVNMASRMMSATKQYNVTILLSQAVEELLSQPARSKLRHLDTVTVKGSSVAQRIFTYDARYEGVDFFLLERSPEQADFEADSYNTTIWENDQDLRSMRQHITDEFTELFKKGVEQYLAGEWKAAIETLRDADDLMIQCILEEGYIDYKMEDVAEELFDRRTSNEEVTRIRRDFGDGACKCLVSYMEKRKGIAPDDWKGVRVLTSK